MGEISGSQNEKWQGPPLKLEKKEKKEKEKKGKSKKEKRGGIRKNMASSKILTHG